MTIWKCTSCGATGTRVCNGDNACCTECGDSEGLEEVSESGMTIDPGEKLAFYKTMYNKLINEVRAKHSAETRHQTALRYIREGAARDKAGPETRIIRVMDRDVVLEPLNTFNSEDGGE